MSKIKFIALIIDIIVLYFAIVSAVIFRGFIHNNVIQTTGEWISAHTNIFLPSVIFTIIALYIAGLYDFKILYDRVKTLTLLLYTQFSAVIFSVISFYTFKTELTPKLTLFFYIIFSTLFLFIARIILQKIYTSLQKKVGYFISNNRELIKKISEETAPYDLININWDKLESIINDKDVNNYIFNEEEITPSRLIEIEKLKLKDKNVFSYNQYYEFLYNKVDLDNFSYDRLMKNLSESKETIAHKIFRRVLDLFLGIMIFPILIIVYPFVWIGIYLQDRGDVIFVQDRVGLLGKIVKIFKFRSMTGADLGGIVNEKDAKENINKSGLRVTPFGMFLRKTRIDELPQIINLLKGDISFIGPRISAVGVHNDMIANVPNFNLRLLVPQGLTGWAQVHMNIQPKTYEEHKDRLAYELYYIRHRSIFLDIMIILKTIKTLISRTGA